MKRTHRSSKRPAHSPLDPEKDIALALSYSISDADPRPAAKAEEAFFSSWCEDNNCRVQTIIGDGHCLFRCVHYFHGIGPPEGFHYRSLAASQMRSDVEFYRQQQFCNADGTERSDPMNLQEFYEYLDALECGFFKNSPVYGDHVCLFALAKALEVTFRVISCGPNSNPSVIEVPDIPVPGRPVHVLAFHQHMYSGHHYNLLLPRDTPLTEPGISNEHPQVSQVATEDRVYASTLNEGNPKRSRRVNTSSCTGLLKSIQEQSHRHAHVPLLCAVSGKSHPDLSSYEQSFQNFGSAVSEVRQALERESIFITWAPQSKVSSPHVYADEQIRVMSSVIRLFPNGAVVALIKEMEALDASVRKGLEQGVKPRLKRAVITTAPSQQFRNTALTENLGANSSSSHSKRVILEQLAAEKPVTHTCRYCNTILLGKTSDRYREEEGHFCCGKGDRLHEPWPILPRVFNEIDFAESARVINCLLSIVTIYGKEDEGFNYRKLSYQQPVMTINGQTYARFMRKPSNCWFLNDSDYDERYADLMNDPKKSSMLSAFKELLRKRNSLNRQLESGWSVKQMSQHNSQVYVNLSEETRMCCVFVADGHTNYAPERVMKLNVVGGGAAIEEDSPMWELFAYSIMHFTGNVNYAWFPGKLSKNGKKLLSLKAYLRSIMFTQPGFWTYGRLAEQFILDTYCRQEQISVRHWRSEKMQEKLRNFARACGRVVSPQKVFMPASHPGSSSYQRRFFHDVLHISRIEGASHLFITFTCNANWPEIRALLGGCEPNAKNSSHQLAIARVFVMKRRKLLDCLNTRNYLFEGHLGISWLVYSTEWQKGDLPHAHIACRLSISPSVPMATQLDHLNLMNKVVSATKPAPHEPHYHQVIAFMQHPNPCQSCMQPKKTDPTVKECRFRYPKPVNDQARIDNKGFPVYVRGPDDVRIVAHNARILQDFNCHVNVEWTFCSLYFAYLYSYMCKGVDRAGFKIRDQIDEISAFRKARVLTVAEAVYRTAGFNVNYRDPPVIVCPIHLPRGRYTSHGEPDLDDGFEPYAEGCDEFGDHERGVEGLEPQRRERGDTAGIFKFDYVEHYFQADRDDSMKFCDYFAQYHKVGNVWDKRRTKMLARMNWYPPTSGEIFFLRTLLLHIPARNYADLYGGFPTFKKHCVELGLVDDGQEYLHGMQEAVAQGFSPATCRHLFAQFINCSDTIDLSAIWRNETIISCLRYDFLSSDHEGNTEKAAQYALMDVATMVHGMGSGAVAKLFTDKGIPDPPTIKEMAALHESDSTSIAANARVFKSYADIVGYSVRTKTIIPLHQREIMRFREITRILTSEELIQDLASLNGEQKQMHQLLFDSYGSFRRDREANALNGRAYLFNLNASAGCGKTYLANRFLNSARSIGAITVSVCSVGIGALHYSDGRTVHNMFSLPLKDETDVVSGQRLHSTLEKTIADGHTSSRIEFLKIIDIIVWDELGTIKKSAFEAVDRLMRRVKGTDAPFGGVFVLTLGDWKQCPPVDDDNDRVRFWDGDQLAFETIFGQSIKSSVLFENKFRKYHLTRNERSKDDPEWQKTVVDIGVGCLGENISIEYLNVRTFTQIGDACRWLFEEDIPSPYDPITVSKRTIMSPFNRNVDAINEYCEEQIFRVHPDTEIVELLSVDEFTCPEEVIPERFAKAHDSHDEAIHRRIRDQFKLDFERPRHSVEDGEFEGFNFDVGEAVSKVHIDYDTFPVEILNSMSFKSVPPHRLRLYKGCVVILLRNLDPANRLQNGVRLFVKDFVRGRRVIVVTKAEDEEKYANRNEEALPPPKQFLLHRIKFGCKVGGSKDEVITRKQFPVRVCNAISIHKSQSMTLERSVIDARDGVFEHGQSFVAFSRNRCRKDVALLIRDGQKTVRNIVLDVFLEPHEREYKKRRQQELLKEGKVLN